MNAICRGSLQKNAVATIVNIHQEASWSEEPLGVQKDAVLLAQSLNTHVELQKIFNVCSLNKGSYDHATDFFLHIVYGIV